MDNHSIDQFLMMEYGEKPAVEISTDTIKAIRSLCEDIIALDGHGLRPAQPPTMRAMAILTMLDIQERRHGAAKPPG